MAVSGLTRRFAGRFLAWLAQNVAGSIIAILVASITTFLLLRLEQVFETEFYAIGEEGQIAYPEGIFELARSEDYVIEFDPPELEQVGVCDYSSESGPSWWDLAQGYLQKYPRCFQISKVGEKSIKVFPDRSPCSELRETDGRYWCRCSPAFLRGG